VTGQKDTTSSFEIFFLAVGPLDQPVAYLFLSIITRTSRN
jgi:hypothetical protein